ncbi:MAG: BatA domain-containing protein, partial [Planctomycetaceae bacterium]
MSLIAGLAVVTVPILLHLFGQRQPQLIDFPALRFVRQTTREQSSSWQLRHFLLLMLRVLLLALLALALARPRIHSAMLGSALGITGVALGASLASLIAAVAFVSRRPAVISWTALTIAIALWLSAAMWGYKSLMDGPVVPSSDQSAPVAAVMIVDNGPSLAYRANNALRLETAREAAIWILDKLPLDSRVGVLAGVPVASLSLDPATAKAQVKQIEQRGSHIDLAGRIRTAIDLVLATDLQRKEVYVITDLVSSSWSGATDDLQKLLKEYSEDVLIQIIDVGDVDTANWRLGDAKPDFQTIPENGEITIEVAVERPATASNKSATIELIQEDIDPKLPVISNGILKTPATRVVDRQVVDLASDRIANVKLTAKELKAGCHNFTVRLDQRDPLQLDNERYVTVLANEQRPALVVADDDDIALNIQLTIDHSAVNSSQSVPLSETVRYSQLGR